jgi:hypothetical protein
VDVLGALGVDASEAAGAIATALGFLGAVAIAVFYGRKATANVTAAAYLADGAVLLSTRPSVCAVGLFRCCRTARMITETTFYVIMEGG